ncbi:MAG TPA: hypothetical protein VMF52_18415 [Steroidobacteraceae bacterium]|nr:hypothetical protein [Steroidobacteraceae bacterium]
MKRLVPALLSALAMTIAAAPALSETPSLPSMTPPPATGASIGSSASISLGSGPHKGKYDFAPTEACVLTAFGKKPLGLSVVFTNERASMSVDMPNIDEKHANEIQVVLVVSDAKPGDVRKVASSVTYEIDTRPDAALEPYQKAERANKGLSGKATTALMQKGNAAMLTFSGETPTGVKVEGEVNCRKVDAAQ